MNHDIKVPELLAPAGNFERMKMALHFGADAVYVGAKRLSLRAFADNFTLEELEIAAAYAHERKKRIYVALNAYLHEDDLPELDVFIRDLEATGIDALIVSDPASIRIARRAAPKLSLHLSTQANMLNSEAAAFWYDAGIERIILARECSANDIRKMREKLPEDLELEAFVHGAMCISYSGRCLLSSFMNGRDGNRGACTQVCRRGFEIREMNSAHGNADLYPVEEDERATYLLNSRDLNLIEDLGVLRDAGVMSFKIEGRMKTAYYVATVVNAYRMAIDDLVAGRPLRQNAIDELEKFSHRPYCKGFLYEGEGLRESQWENPSEQSHEFVAVVLDYDGENKTARIEQRNRFFLGDELEVLSPGKTAKSAVVKSLRDLEGNIQDSAPHPQQLLDMEFDLQLQAGDILRKKII